MSASITIDVSEVVKKLDPVEVERAIEAALSGAADIVRADMRVYPPPPEESTYVRTGKLGQSWTKKVERRQATIGNITPYAPYVQDTDRQAWMHKGRWQTTREVAEKRAQDVKRFVERALERWAKR